MKSAHKKIYLKIQELLSFFHREQTNYQIHLMPFLNKKATLLDKNCLRENLIDQIKSHQNYKGGSDNWEKLLKLGTKPLLPKASVSISYCGFLGVCVIVFDEKVSIGFDIEQSDRIKSQVARRISSNKEFKQSPHPSLLWVAKEACVKSLSTRSHPVLFKDCILSNWKSQPFNQNYFFDFYLRNGHKYKGTAGFLDEWVLAYAEKQI